MVDVAFPLQIFGLKPAFRYHTVEFYVWKVGQTAFGLVHPVAVERGFIATLLVVPGVAKDVVQFEPLVPAVFLVSLIIETKYVDVRVSQVTGQSKCRGSTAPTEARLEPIGMIQNHWDLLVLGVEV